MADPDASVTRVQTRATKKKPAHASAPPKVNLSVQDRRHKTRLLNETQRRKEQLLGLTTRDVATHLHRFTVHPSTVMDESREGYAMPVAAPAAAGASRGVSSSVSEPRVHAAVFSSAAAAGPSRPVGSGVVEVAEAAGSERDPNTRWHTQYAHHLQHRKTAGEALPTSAPASPSPSLRFRDQTGDENGGGGEGGRSMDDNIEVLPPTSYEEWLARECPTGSWAALLQEEVYAPVAAEKALLTAKYDPKRSKSTTGVVSAIEENQKQPNAK